MKQAGITISLKTVDYERETAWAPSCLAGELRESHLEEDQYRADAVRAWHRAEAAVDIVDRARAEVEAEQLEALAQEVGSYREALAEVVETRRRWHASTELVRQAALSADAELRRRHPDVNLPQLNPRPETSPAGAGQNGEVEVDRDDGNRADHGQQSDRVEVLRNASADIYAALGMARQAEVVLVERERQAGRDGERADADLVGWQQAEAERLAAARRDAVRQEPAPSHRRLILEREEPELEVGL